MELKAVTVSDDSGNYRFDNVPNGRYTVTAHQEGFADATQKIAVNGADVEADFVLQLSGVKEEVTVTANGVEQSTFEAIESVSTVSSDQIAERAAVGLGEVLDKEPGVAKRSFGAGKFEACHPRL